MTEIKLGKYRHFKGEEVEVIGVAKHSETLEELVVYKTLGESKGFPAGTMWARPVKMFLEKVERDGEAMKRFEYIG